MLTAAGHDLPIIFVTGHADVPLTVRAMKAGALEVLHEAVRGSGAAGCGVSGARRWRVARIQREELQLLRRRYETLTPHGSVKSWGSS